jgi:hypothetical protein
MEGKVGNIFFIEVKTRGPPTFQWILPIQDFFTQRSGRPEEAFGI